MEAVYKKNILKKAFFPWRTYLSSNTVSPTKRDTRIRCGAKPRKTSAASTSNIKA